MRISADLTARHAKADSGCGHRAAHAVDLDCRRARHNRAFRALASMAECASANQGGSQTYLQSVLGHEIGGPQASSQQVQRQTRVTSVWWPARWVRTGGVSAAALQLQPRASLFGRLIEHLVDHLLAGLCGACGLLRKRCVSLNQHQGTVLTCCLDLGQHFGTRFGAFPVIGMLGKAGFPRGRVIQRIGLRKHWQCKHQSDKRHVSVFAEVHGPDSLKKWPATLRRGMPCGMTITLERQLQQVGVQHITNQPCTGCSA